MLSSLRSGLTRVTDKLTGGARRADEPPLIRPPLPFLGHALAMGRDLTAMLRACQRDHGDIFTLLIAGRRMHFILDPLSFPHVLKAQDNLTFHEIGDEIGRRAFGYTSLPEHTAAIEAVSHDHLKSSALPPLTSRMHARLLAAFARFTADAWQDDHLFAFAGRCIFFAGLETLFGEGVADDDALADFHRHDRRFTLMAAGVPPAALPGVVAARDRLRRRLVPRPDASAFIRVRDEMFARITTETNRQHLQFSLVWASQANTLPAAFWSLFHLLHDPHGRAVVEAEVTALGLHDLKRLPQLHSSVSESLRLTSQSLTIRLVQRDCRLTLAGDRTVALRAGDRVVLCPQITHHDPEVFTAPHEFRHDRFLADSGPRHFFKHGQRVPIPLMPYGGGVSMCPGRFLADNEISLFLGLALTTLDIELLDTTTPALDTSRAGLGVLPPARDVRCRIRRRPAA